MAYIFVPVSYDSVSLTFDHDELTPEQLRGLKLFFGELKVEDAYDKKSKRLEKTIEIGGTRISVTILEAMICNVIGEETLPVPDSSKTEAEKLLALTAEEAQAYLREQAAKLLTPPTRPIYDCTPAEQAEKPSDSDFQF